MMGILGELEREGNVIKGCSRQHAGACSLFLLPLLLFPVLILRPRQQHVGRSYYPHPCRSNLAFTY